MEYLDLEIRTKKGKIFNILPLGKIRASKKTKLKKISEKMVKNSKKCMSRNPKKFQTQSALWVVAQNGSDIKCFETRVKKSYPKFDEFHLL